MTGHEFHGQDTIMRAILGSIQGPYWALYTGHIGLYLRALGLKKGRFGVELYGCLASGRVLLNLDNLRLSQQRFRNIGGGLWDPKKAKPKATADNPTFQ